MAGLSLSFLGSFTATLNDQPLGNFPINKVQVLLIYLAAENDRPHRRESQMELLWPRMPRKSARTALGETAFDAAYDEGRAMTMEQVIAMALADSDDWMDGSITAFDWGPIEDTEVLVTSPDEKASA